MDKKTEKQFDALPFNVLADGSPVIHRATARRFLEIKMEDKDHDIRALVKSKKDLENALHRLGQKK